ncbi:uncharacterized protein [Montipora capricornis]|uniref:uncharacterized protein n=1 Tax=Montipora capricornis TaxID=246305 RepID=UPI0035F1FED4
MELNSPRGMFYDLLGFLSPYVIRSTLLIQKAWLEARDWDELLPTPHQREWTKWFRELEDLELVNIPRCLKNPSPEMEELSIHTFGDASENAYTAVVYARHVYEDGNITTRLIMSKSRLAQLKAISTKGVTYSVDSINVGYWIQGQSREYKPFIDHRVGDIHDFSAPNQWRYVLTDVNPADFGTRGETVEEHTLTYGGMGPNFSRSQNKTGQSAKNCRKSAEQREKGELKPLEIQNAEEFIIREVQSKVYASEIEALRRNKEILGGSTLAPLNPVSVNGIMRCNTRLRHADDLPYDLKCSIILPKRRNHVTGLIVKYYHELEGHQMGLIYTINHVREKYLVVLVREQVKRVMTECFECARRLRSKPASQQMAPLDCSNPPDLSRSLQ